MSSLNCNGTIPPPKGNVEPTPELIRILTRFESYLDHLNSLSERISKQSQRLSGSDNVDRLQDIKPCEGTIIAEFYNKLDRFDDLIKRLTSDTAELEACIGGNDGQ